MNVYGTHDQVRLPPEGWRFNHVTLTGDALLDGVIESVSGDDAEKRDWARTVVENEDIVVDFVTDLRRTLRQARETSGLSIEAAADLMGVSAPTLARLERGAASQPDLKLVARLSLMMGLVPRLDFARLGSSAKVSVSDRNFVCGCPGGLGQLEQSLAASPPVSLPEGRDEVNRVEDISSGPPIAAHDAVAVAVDQRIRDLEARIAAMERGGGKLKSECRTGPSP